MWGRSSRVALAGAGLLSLSALPLAGQQASYHDLLIRMRDTVTSVEAAVWDFNRDLQRAAPETVIGRAAKLRNRCQAAAPSMSNARKQLQPATATAKIRREAASLVEAIVTLEQVMARECERGFREGGPGKWADSLRAWGPFRGSQISGAIRAYESSASRFATAAGFKLEPKIPPR